MARLIIKIKGDQVETTVDGVKGAKCTEITKLLDKFKQLHNGRITKDVKTKAYHETEQIAEHIHR